jgi:hypothetical protein
VFEGCINDVDLDFMLLKPGVNPVDVVQDFDLYICQAWIDKNSFKTNNLKVHGTEGFLKDIKDKTMTYNKECPKGTLKLALEKHFPKMQEKFPEYRFNFESYNFEARNDN